ncbi:MAG: serine kinase [Candidatus Eisenbacteria sp.]|nr:serine kinase [Candidatus Eisenbacteria bacterium]
MKLSEIVQTLDLSVKTAPDHLDVEVTKGYISDMLSDVMGNAEEGSLWITIQKHQNIVAVAVMKSLAGIVLVKSREPDEDTVQKAEHEEVVILSTPMGAFELAGKLSNLGIMGD